MQATELQREALERATQGESMANYGAIFSGFMARGIPESDIHPRENVLTFHAWKAKGRVVKRGEHGVKVVTWIPVRDKDTDEVTGKRCKTAVVFHETQTTELGARSDSAADRNSYADNRRRENYEPVIRDPGEDSADRWNETHGDRWQES